MKTKICSSCREEKEIERFQKKGEGFSSQCKDCRNKYNREVWYKNNKERQKEQTAKWKKKNKSRVIAVRHNLNEEEVKKALNNFNGFCQICGRETDGKEVLDHCHETKKVRGVICFNCNTLLGRLGDNLESVKDILNRFERYLS